MLKFFFKLCFLLLGLMILKEFLLFKNKNPSPQLPPLSSPYLKWPLEKGKNDSQINSGFEDDWISDCGFVPKKHVGIDIDAKVGDNVLAAKTGSVIKIFQVETPDGKDWGDGIVIGHGEYTTVYMHVDPLVKEGQPVGKGQIIARISNIRGYHLHFGIRKLKYDKFSKRGALPLKKTNDNDYCRYDPIFPGNFIDPFALRYD